MFLFRASSFSTTIAPTTKHSSSLFIVSVSLYSSVNIGLVIKVASSVNHRKMPAPLRAPPQMPVPYQLTGHSALLVLHTVSRNLYSLSSRQQWALFHCLNVFIVHSCSQFIILTLLWLCRLVDNKYKKGVGKSLK